MRLRNAEDPRAPIERRMHARAFASLALLALLAGCTAEGASKGNFTLVPERVGWFAGDTATFTLTIGTSLLNDAPTFTIDRRFAIERIDLSEAGLRAGGDYSTKDPDAIGLTLSREGNVSDEFVLDRVNSSLDITIRLPEELRDSEYALELDLFRVGWVKSDAFRVDKR